MHRRALTMVSALALAGSALVAAPGPASATPAAPAAAAAAAAPVSDSSDAPTVVQLGDSYSAGNGAGSYLERTCWRSPRNYGAPAAAAMGAKYVNVACSGGVVRDIVQPRSFGGSFLRTKTYRVPRSLPDRRAEWMRQAQAANLCGIPAQDDWYYTYTRIASSTAGDYYTATVRCRLTAKAQIDAVNESTTAVFVTIGGNDVGFTEIVTQCIALRDEGGCRRQIESAQSLVPTMKSRTKDALRQVHERSGGRAKVYLLSYPYLLKRESFLLPDIAPRYDAGAALNRLQDSGTVAQADLMSELNAETGTDHFVYVDTVTDEWGGRTHSIDTRLGAHNYDAWLWPILATGREYAEWMHPKPEGWAASSRALQGKILRS